MVPMVAPDGTVYKVPGESVLETLAGGEGWQLDSPEAARARQIQEFSEEHPIISGITAGASEAADVASFGQTAIARGLTSKAAKAAGAPNLGGMATDIEALKEANPISTGVGMVGGALLGGAEGATGKALKGAAEATGLARLMPGIGVLESGAAGETGLLSRAGAAVTKHGVTGAVEGAALGAGTEIGRQATGDKDFAAEKILASAGGGAAFGGAFGGLLGGVGRLGGDAVGSMAGRLSPEHLALEGMGATKAEIAKLIRVRGKDEVNKIARELLNEEGLIARGSSLEEISEKAGAARERVGNEIGQFLKRVDEIPWYKPNKTRMLAEVDDLVGELRSKNVGPDIALAKEIERQWRPGIVKAESAEELQQFRVRFDKYKQKVWNTERDAAKDAYYRKFSSIVESNVERDVEGAIKAASELGDTGLANDYLRLKAKSQAFIVGGDIAEKAASREAAGIGGGVGLGDVVRGGLGYAGALAHGLGGLPAMGIGLATDLAWRGIKSRQTSVILARAFDALRGGVDATSLRLSNTVRQTLTDGSKALIQTIPTATGKVIQRYQESSKLAQQVRANPPVAMAKVERAVAPISVVDPELGKTMNRMMQDDLTWLTSKLPPPGTNSVFSVKGLPGGGGGKRGRGRPKGGSGPMATTARISITAASKFNRYERALGNPLAAIGDMRNGRLAPETAEVLRDRRPALREQIRNEVSAELAEMSERGKVPTRKTRVQLSLVTGVPMDATMAPEFIASVQNFWAQESQQAAQPPQAPPRRETSARMRDRARSRASAGDAIGEDEDVG
jgi:hypothetical protein